MPRGYSNVVVTPSLRKQYRAKRSARVPTAPKRKAAGSLGPRTVRARKAAAAKSVKPKTQGSQMGYKTSTLTLAKPMSRSAMTAKLTQSMLSSVIYRWNGVKAFSGNGKYWMQNRTITGVRYLPWYMLDLTAVNNMRTTGAAIVSYPMVQLQQDAATGNMYFGSVSGFSSDGATAISTYAVEQAAVSTGAGISNDVYTASFDKSMINSASIQANLWGATAKATKYMVQVVQISDEDLVPDHALAQAGTELTVATPKRNDFYQNMIKSWTFNPISTTGGLSARKYKVLKTQTITIEPNPTTDGDVDPQCVVYKAFLKLNKLMKYQETATWLKTDVDTNDQGDYAVNTGIQVTAQANPKSRIYLVIRATNYGADAGDTNVNTPSFDLSVRIKHTIPK